MTARSKARKRALDLLYEADLRGLDPAGLLAERVPEQPYARELVAGVVEHRARIDELLLTYSSGWTVDRMPVVDRNVLRLGVYELVYRDDVPDAVAIDEAVRLAADLSTEESPSFVNGVLARLLELKPSLLR